MVVNDYGKRAYVKLCDLENRIEKLENFAIETAYSEIFFNFNEGVENTNFTRSFKVLALKEGRYTIDGSVQTNLFSLNGVLVKIYVGEVLAGSFINNTDIELPYVFEVVFSKGVNVIRIELSAETKFTVKEFNLKVRGYVSYVESKNSLSHTLYNGVDYTLQFLDEKALLFTYTPSTGLVLVNTFYNLLESSILGVDSNNIYILAITKERTLKIISYNYTTLEITEISLQVNNVLSACGFSVDGGFKIYFSILNEVYVGNYYFDSEFNYTSTGRKGVKLYADSDTLNTIIVVDAFNNAKLVAEWYSQ